MEFEQFAGFGVAPKPDFWIGEGAPNEPRDARRVSRGHARAGRRVLQARRWPPAAATTARRACGRTTTPITTARSCSTRTATTSKPSAMRLHERDRSRSSHRTRRNVFTFALRRCSLPVAVALSPRRRPRRPGPTSRSGSSCRAPAGSSHRRPRPHDRATSSRTASASRSSSRTSRPPAAPSRRRKWRRRRRTATRCCSAFNGPLVDHAAAVRRCPTTCRRTWRR